MNMRILLATGSFPPMKCGVGDYSQNLSDALAADNRFRVGILTSTIGAGRDKVENIEVFPVIKKWGLIETLKVIKIIRNWSPDIVHIQYPTQGYGKGLLPWILPMIAFLMGKKVVQTWHEGYSLGSIFKLFLISIIPSVLVFVRPRYKECLHPMLFWALWGKNSVFIPNASTIPGIVLDEQIKNILKNKYLNNQKRLIVFFGFVYPSKGVELLFEIADPASDQIVIVGEINNESEYSKKIMKHALVEPWLGKVTITGFLSIPDVAELLVVADAVILPFRTGGGEWNTSIHGAVLNRTFVITTSLTKRGYNNKYNIYFAKIDNIQEMKLALNTYAGKRRVYDADIDMDEWGKIAKQHFLLYENFLSK